MQVSVVQFRPWAPPALSSIPHLSPPRCMFRFRIPSDALTMGSFRIALASSFAPLRATLYLLCHRPMQPDQVRYGFWRPPSEAAFGGDPEIRYDPLRCSSAPVCAFDAVGEMDQAEVQFRPRLELQMTQRFEIRIVVPVARHRHMKPRDRSMNRLCQPVIHVDHAARIRWFADMLVAGIAVAEVETEFDVRRDPIAHPGERFHQLVNRIFFLQLRHFEKRMHLRSNID